MPSVKTWVKVWRPVELVNPIVFLCFARELQNAMVAAPLLPWRSKTMMLLVVVTLTPVGRLSYVCKTISLAVIVLLRWALASTSAKTIQPDSQPPVVTHVVPPPDLQIAACPFKASSRTLPRAPIKSLVALVMRFECTRFVMVGTAIVSKIVPTTSVMSNSISVTPRILLFLTIGIFLRINGIMKGNIWQTNGAKPPDKHMLDWRGSDLLFVRAGAIGKKIQLKHGYGRSLACNSGSSIDIFWHPAISQTFLEQAQTK